VNPLSPRALRNALLAASFTLPLVALPATMASGVSVPQWSVAHVASPVVDWSAVDFLNGRWIALSDVGEFGFSTNGATWSDQSAPVGSWQGAAYGAGRYVALSSANVVPNEAISSNGLQWSTLSGPPGTPHQAGRPEQNGQWTGVAFGHGVFAAVSSVGTLDTSSNGVTWTQRFWRPRNSFSSITYGDGRFIAVDAAQGDVLMSLDGIHWSLIQKPLIGAVPAPAGGLHFRSVAYGNGNFVAFGDSASGTQYVATSVFGYVWALHPYSSTQAIDSVTFGCGSFVAAGESTGTANGISSSSTGATWTTTPVTTTAASNWTSVSYGSGRYVAVDSAGDVALSRSNADCAGSVPTPPQQVSGNVHNGEVWTYMHPSASSGGAAVEGYRVAITDGTTTTSCHAAVYYQPNCIIKGLRDNKVYWVTTQAYNRYGYSAPSDPEYVIPMASWTLNVAPSVSAGIPSPAVQVTGVLANSLGFYPVTTVSVHVGPTVATCHPNPFGECVISLAHAPAGAAAVFATYTGYGRTYRSPTSEISIASS
jgi:hypothetical protein